MYGRVLPTGIISSSWMLQEGLTSLFFTGAGRLDHLLKKVSIKNSLKNAVVGC